MTGRFEGVLTPNAHGLPMGGNDPTYTSLLDYMSSYMSSWVYPSVAAPRRPPNEGGRWTMVSLSTTTSRRRIKKKISMWGIARRPTSAATRRRRAPWRGAKRDQNSTETATTIFGRFYPHIGNRGLACPPSYYVPHRARRGK